MRPGSVVWEEVMMKNKILRVPLLLLGAVIVPAHAATRSGRVHLFPQLKSGQVLRYLISYRADKQVKTQSNMVSPVAPSPAQLDARGLLVIEILEVQPAGAQSVLHARAHFEDSNPKQHENSTGQNSPDAQSGHSADNVKSVEFMILPDGRAEKVQGLENLTQEQQQSWGEWLSLFAAAGVFPADGVKQGEKWKAMTPESVPSLIADLRWEKESTYVRDEPCGSTQPNETCAVILTESILKQKSSPQDATPEDFKLHQLRTIGTARGTNETITYISLKTGLVVRATEEAAQLMDVTVAKSDGSNQVHYDIDAKSHAEILLLSGQPPNP
jgi:hypothetical protein